MPAAKKKKPTAPAPHAAKAAAVNLAVVALERLSDPKVRDELVKQGRAFAALVDTWRDERKRKPSPLHDGESPAKPGSAGGRFGQRKLEGRVENLRASLANLASGRPELSGLLEVPTANLNEIASALGVAGALPLVKRKRAHFLIDQRLDQLEAMVFKASMPKAD